MKEGIFYKNERKIDVDNESLQINVIAINSRFGGNHTSNEYYKQN